MIYAAIILLIAGVIICHFHDWKDARNGHTNHSRNLKWKILSAIPAGILFLINLTGYPPTLNWDVFLASGKSVVFGGAWFLFLFNSIWGWRADKDIFYRSTAVGKNISRWDRLVLPLPKLLYAFLIVLLVCGATILYFL